VTEAIIISVVDDAHSHVFPFVIRSVIGKMHMLLNSLAPHASLFPRILLPQDINNEFITWIFYYNSGFLLSMLMLREMHLLREITLSFQCLMKHGIIYYGYCRLFYKLLLFLFYKLLWLKASDKCINVILHKEYKSDFF